MLLEGMEDYTRMLSNEPSFKLGVRFTRFALLATLFLVSVFHNKASAVLQDFWSYARETSFVRLDTFEPLVATVGFTWCVAMYRLMDRTPFFWHYKFNTCGKKPEQAHGVLPPLHVLLSLVFYLGPLFVFDMAFPRRDLPVSAPTVFELLFQCMSSLLLYDFLFFWIHLAMHKVSALRFLHHGAHHTKNQLDASEVSMNIVALNLLQMHALSRLCHNIIVTYLLTEDHCGYNLPFMLHNVIPFGVFGGPVVHETHHKRGNQHYQQFFTYLDNALGLGSEHTRTSISKVGMQNEGDGGVCKVDSWKAMLGGLILVAAASVAASARWYWQLPSWADVNQINRSMISVFNQHGSGKYGEHA